MDISTCVQTFGLFNLYACFWGFIILNWHSLIESSWAHTIHLAISLPPFTRAPKYSNKKSEESLVCALHIKHSCSWKNTCLFHVCTLITTAELLPFSCSPLQLSVAVLEHTVNSRLCISFTHIHVQNVDFLCQCEHFYI